MATVSSWTWFPLILILSKHICEFKRDVVIRSWIQLCFCCFTVWWKGSDWGPGLLRQLPAGLFFQIRTHCAAQAGLELLASRPVSLSFPVCLPSAGIIGIWHCTVLPIERCSQLGDKSMKLAIKVGSQFPLSRKHLRQKLPLRISYWSWTIFL